MSQILCKPDLLIHPDDDPQMIQPFDPHLLGSSPRSIPLVNSWQASSGVGRGVASRHTQERRDGHAAFPSGNRYMQRRDVLGSISRAEQCADLFARRGRPVVPPWRLALVTVRQFAEGLADRQAADARRARIDWKDALGLELTDAGFDYSV